MSKRSAGRRFGIKFGVLSATSIVLVVLTDLARRSITGEPILLTVAPAGLAWLGSLLVLILHGIAWVPKLIRQALFCLLSCLVLSTLVAFAKQVPSQQIVIGAVALASPAPCLLLGLAMTRNQKSVAIFNKTIILVLSFSIIVAMLQQFGMLKADVLGMLEEAVASRGLDSGGVFAYTSGPFRTANVFAFFLALGGAVLIDELSGKADQRKSFSVAGMGFIGVTVLSSILTARRTGLSMLLGAVVPSLIRARSITKLLLAGLIALLAITIFGQLGDFESGDLQYKVMHVSSESTTGTRLLEAFDVDSSDWDEVSLTGSGLGAFGAGRSFGRSEATKDMFGTEHRIAHVGWFKDLLAYGLLGMLLHLAWFCSLLWAAIKYAKKSKRISRWNAAGFLSFAMFNYYFIATSWIQGLSGGLFFGLLMGYLLGRLSSVQD